jgi:hypothetical protein
LNAVNQEIISNNYFTIYGTVIIQTGATVEVYAPTFIFNEDVTITSVTGVLVTVDVALLFEYPVEFCGSLFWCCTNHTFAVSTVTDWTLPSERIVYVVVPDSGGTTIDNIVPNFFDGAVGPEVIWIVNQGVDPLIITGGAPLGGPDAGGGYKIFLPPVYGASVTLEYKDTIGLWLDLCADDKAWKVLACTVQPSSGGATSDNGDSSINSDYTMTGTFAGSGLKVNLPVSGGKYLVICQAYIQGTAITANAVEIQLKLRDTTAGTDIQKTLVELEMVAAGSTSTSLWDVITLTALITASATNATIELWATCNLFTGTVTGTLIHTGSNILFVRVS